MNDNRLTKLDGSKDLAKTTKLYLLNMNNGRVFDWTTYLSVRDGFIDCTVDGEPIDPRAVPGDHAWIKEQSEGLRERIRCAGVGIGASDIDIDNMLLGVGMELSEQGKRKFKSLEYEKSKTYRLEGSKSAAQTGATIRVYNKIDAACDRAKAEISEMADKARADLFIKIDSDIFYVSPFAAIRQVWYRG